MKTNAIENVKPKKKKSKIILTIFFTLVSIFYVFPVFMVLVNSFKANTFVKTETFAMPNAESFVGFDNFIKGVTFGGYPFWQSLLYSVIITILSAFLILLYLLLFLRYFHWC